MLDTPGKQSEDTMLEDKRPLPLLLSRNNFTKYSYHPLSLEFMARLVIVAGPAFLSHLHTSTSPSPLLFLVPNTWPGLSLWQVPPSYTPPPPSSSRQLPHLQGRLVIVAGPAKFNFSSSYIPALPASASARLRPTSPFLPLPIPFQLTPPPRPGPACHCRKSRLTLPHSLPYFTPFYYSMSEARLSLWQVPPGFFLLPPSFLFLPLSSLTLSLSPFATPRAPAAMGDPK